MFFSQFCSVMFCNVVGPLKTFSAFFQVPFREAHSLSGAAVHAAEKKSCPLNELTLDDLKEVRCVSHVKEIRVTDNAQCALKEF